MRARRRAARS